MDRARMSAGANQARTWSVGGRQTNPKPTKPTLNQVNHQESINRTSLPRIGKRSPLDSKFTPHVRLTKGALRCAYLRPVKVCDRWASPGRHQTLLTTFATVPLGVDIYSIFGNISKSGVKWRPFSYSGKRCSISGFLVVHLVQGWFGVGLSVSDRPGPRLFRPRAHPRPVHSRYGNGPLGTCV